MREIALAEALALLRWPGHRVRLHAVVAGRAPSWPFHSDPATGAPARGREYDLDGGRRWRLVVCAGGHYLARHTDRRDFEYWRITDWPGQECARVIPGLTWDPAPPLAPTPAEKPGPRSSPG